VGRVVVGGVVVGLAVDNSFFSIVLVVSFFVFFSSVC